MSIPASSATLPPTIDRSQASRWSAPANIVLAVLLGLALMLVAPLAKLGLWMVSRDFYQHVPMMALFAVGLAVYRYRENPIGFVAPVASPRVLIWTLFAAVLIVAAYVLPSRWMAAPATLLLSIAATHFVGGRSLVRQLRGPLVVLAACIPLPVLWDGWFVIQMQQLATWVASLWLDLGGVLHFATGVDIRTPKEQFTVADACSGIHSMFAAIAVGVGYGALRNYRLRGIAGLVIQIVFWVVLANAVRVFALVYLQTRYEFDLSSGWRHDVLGMVTFAGGLLLAASSDHFWRYLVPRQRLVGQSAEKATRVEPKIGFLDRPVTRRTATVLVGVLAVVAIGVTVMYSQFGRLSYQRPSLEDLATRSAIDFDAVDETFFPERLDGWQRTGFVVNEKTQDSIFGGMKSFIWRYGSGTRSVLLSVDGPYHDWHDLALCYSGAGWTVDRRDVRPISQDKLGDADRGDGVQGDSEPIVAADLTMRRPPLDRGEVMFACFGPNGECIPPPPHFGDAWVHLVNRVRWGVGDKQEHDGGVIQIQLLDETPVRLSKAQLRQNHQLFKAAVTHAFGSPAPSP